MNWLRKIQKRFRAFFQKEKLDAQMGDEMRSHIEMQTQENIEEGMQPEEARFAALREFGWVESIKETCRDQRGLPLIETLLQDVRFGLRMLRKNPGFTIVAVITLALGIGANTAIFSLINELVLRPLPVKNADELYALVFTDKSGDFADQRIPYPVFQDYCGQNNIFSELSGYATVFAPVLVGEKNYFATAQLVSANFFSILGIVPNLGRTFLPEEDKVGGKDRVVVLSYASWQNWFGGDPTVVGKTVTLQPMFGEPLTFIIIGVAPPTFTGLEKPATQIWLPSGMEDYFKRSQPVNFRMIGRLAQGASPSKAVAGLEVIAHNLAEKYRGAPLPGYESEGVFRSEMKTELRHAALGNWGAFRPHHVLRRATELSLGVAGIVLLIACANISNLLLARAEKRRKEIAIRVALGAKRTQILRQLMTESFLLSLLGGGAGILFAVVLNRLLVTLKPSEVNLVVVATVDHRVAGYALLIAIFAGLAFGTIPAWQAAQSDVNSTLKGDTTAIGKRRGWQVRDLLAAGQIALSLVLLIGAGLCLRSLVELQTTSPGFDVRNLVLAPVDFLDATETSIGPIYEELARRLESTHGIHKISYTRVLPMHEGGLSTRVQQVEGYTPQKSEALIINYTEVGPNYFETMGIPVIQTANQPLEKGNAVVWINESLARKYWPGGAPVGKRIGSWVVNGVVKDSQLKNLTDKPGPYLYVQSARPVFNSLTLIARTDGNVRAAMATILSEVLRVNKDLDISRITSMSQVVSGTLVSQRFLLFLLGGFSISATVLAALGIYGVMSYLVTQRTRELGIRLALGAQRWDLLTLVLGQGIKMTIVGIIFGLLVALATTRVLSSVLYGISPTDPLIFGAISLLLAAVALLACWIPARHAAKVDPMVALRYE